MAGKEEEFEEEEMWAAVKDHHWPHGAARNQPCKDVPILPSSHGSTAKKKHGTSAGSRRSAPVSIPDWSKVHGKGRDDDDGGNDGDGDDDEKVPPHEWLARKMAGSCQISSFSVCEGAGRTLKGRDLSRVRNAVLSKTGFLEDQ